MAKICIISAQYFPFIGGVQQYVRNIASKLTNWGHSIDIITTEAPGLPETEQGPEGMVHRLPGRIFLKGRAPTVKPNRAFFRRWKALGEMPYDLVIVNTQLYPLCIFGCMLGRKKNIPVLLIEHGTGHMMFENPLVTWMASVYEHMLTWIIRRFDVQFYGVASACGDYLRHFHVDMKGVLHNAIDLDAILAQQKEKGQKKVLCESGLSVSYVGRLVSGKGLEKLIDAVKRLQQESYDVCLYIAGEGDIEKNLRERALDAPYIHIMGRISFSEVIDLLSDTDVGCLPADGTEGFPTSLLESAACGQVLVATPRGGVRELIPSKEYGIILEENTVEEMCTVFKHLYEDPFLRKNLAANAFRRVSERFTWDITAGKLLSILEADIDAFSVSRKRVSDMHET